MENEFDSPETAQKFFDRFFAYDLLDRYPNHRIAAEADYSLRLLWSAEKVCIQGFKCVHKAFAHTGAQAVYIPRYKFHIYLLFIRLCEQP